MCEKCNDTGWVDEKQEQPWNPDDEAAGAGRACKCNPTGALPPGSRVCCGGLKAIYTPDNLMP